MKLLFVFLIFSNSCVAQKLISATSIRVKPVKLPANAMILHFAPKNESGVTAYVLERKYYSKWAVVSRINPVGIGTFDYQINYSNTGTYRLRVIGTKSVTSGLILVK